MELKISKMNIADFEQIKNSLTQEFDNFWTPNMLKQELENIHNLNSEYYDAKIENNIVGFVGILTILDEVNIMNIVVKKSNRNLGIASSLLQYIINLSKEKKTKLITLEVNERNIPAIKLYQKFGFKQTRTS